MTAKEARQKAEIVLNNKDFLILTEIYSAIKNKAEKGEFSCTYYATLPSSIEKRLKGEGYKISDLIDPREGTVTIIQW